MKAKKILSMGTALAVSTAFTLFADDASQSELKVRDAARPHVLERLQAKGTPTKASQLLGREITDNNGKKIGKVRDMGVDMQNGRIVFVVVGSGGFLGAKEHDTALPPSELCWDADGKKLMTVIDQEEFRYAPVIDMSHWNDCCRVENVRELYHRYNVAPYFIDDTTRTPAATEVKGASQLTSAGLNSPTVQLGPIEHLRDVMGASVADQGDERLGKVENVIVDLTASRVIVVIVSTGGFLGMGNEVSAIPPQAFQFNQEHNKLTMNTTPAALRTAPHFKPDEWPGVADPDHIATVYNAYKVPPYPMDAAADNTAQNVRDRADATLTPLDQGHSPSDRAITARIRREIMARSDLSTYAHNVKIITVDGAVTLRGPVKSEDEEMKLIEIAKNVVSADSKVNNQIQTINDRTNVKSEPTKYNSTNSN